MKAEQLKCDVTLPSSIPKGRCRHSELLAAGLIDSNANSQNFWSPQTPHKAFHDAVTQKTEAFPQTKASPCQIWPRAGSWRARSRQLQQLQLLGEIITPRVQALKYQIHTQNFHCASKPQIQNIVIRVLWTLRVTARYHQARCTTDARH